MHGAGGRRLWGVLVAGGIEAKAEGTAGSRAVGRGQHPTLASDRHVALRPQHTTVQHPRYRHSYAKDTESPRAR